MGALCHGTREVELRPNTNDIDPDLISLIKDFRIGEALKKNVRVSMQGFDGRYGLDDQFHYPEFSTKEVQNLLTPLANEKKRQTDVLA